MPTILMKQLLEAGVHFGHQTKRWNPKMAEYIFGERNGIYIIDLQKTAKKLKEACDFVCGIVKSGGFILFVGTKKQAQDVIRESAEKCGMFYVNQRWLGGLLTNFQTIRKSVERFKELERMEKEIFPLLPNKEVIKLKKQKAKMEKLLTGIKDMMKLPGAIFIVDSKKERTALLEARKLEIPVVGLVDTNSDPNEIDYVIPGNDDAIRAIKLVCDIISDAVLEGRPKLHEQIMTEKAVSDGEITEQKAKDLAGLVMPAENTE